MSNKLKMLGMLGFIVFAAACARQEEEVIVVEPISEEPVYTGKYK